MQITRLRRRSPGVALAVGAVAALAASTGVPAQGGTATAADSDKLFGKHTTVLTGLDNPRQLSVNANGDLLVAAAGHGSYKPANCLGSGQNATCIGKSGKVIVLRNGNAKTVMKGLLSGAGKDGSFATGADGASKRPGGPVYTIMTTGAPEQELPAGLPGWQAGKVLKKRPNGKLMAVANIGAFEERRDVDNEGVDSNPYSMLALKKKLLVTDAAGDYIAQVRHGKVSLWAKMPEYGKKVDAVPTVVSKGHDGKIYVGELHSEQKGKAKVWKYDRNGDVLRKWGHFTTVTGVARGADGSLYVSELFGGHCSFNQIPDCFPGRVVRVSPNGDRSYRKVPFPAGVAVTHGKVYVAAFSVSPATGFGGNPNWAGAIWRIFKDS
jgi:hypothetical protein